MVRFAPLLLFLALAAPSAARSGPSRTDDPLLRADPVDRTHIRVLPRPGEEPSPRVLVSPGTDLWLTEGRDRGEPGVSLSWDGFLHDGPVRLSLFIDGGFLIRRTARTEERFRTVDVGGEPVVYAETFLIEEESLVPGAIFGVALAFGGGFGDGGFWTGSVGLGGTVTGPKWGGGIRGSFSTGWRTGPWFLGFRVGADARRTGELHARITLGISGGLAF